MTGRSGQQLAEQLQVNRLDQVVIEARGARRLPVFILSSARERQQSGLLGLGSCPQSPGDFVSIHARHTDVKDDHLRLEICGQCEGRWAIMGMQQGDGETYTAGFLEALASERRPLFAEAVLFRFVGGPSCGGDIPTTEKTPCGFC